MFTLPGKDGVTDFPLPDEDGMFQHPNGRTYRQSSGILDLIEGDWDQTADHYTEQWGPDSDFQAFARQNPEAMRFTPGRQLGWPMLFESIRTRALDIPTLVYDAGCGFGGVLDALFAEPSPCSLYYLGADIHGSLATVRRPERVGLDRVRLVRWDISRPLPFRQKFDFVICRASIHHTVEPRTTFKSLVASLAAHGTIAISAYTTKSRPREAIDNSLRAEISQMPVEAAKRVSREFSILARDIQQAKARIRITETLPFLRIPAGNYAVHEFIYNFLMKNWYNEMFGLDLSDLVNFDWYHPQFAYRYDKNELLSWFNDEDLDVTFTATTEAQHYVQGTRLVPNEA